MRAIYINVETKTVEEIDSKLNLEDLQKLVGGWIEYLPIRRFVPQLSGHDAVFNEEGMLKRLPAWRFKNQPYMQDFHGSAVIHGELNNAGLETPATISAEAVAELIQFY